jgi:serine/threonine-protein kinase
MSPRGAVSEQEIPVEVLDVSAAEPVPVKAESGPAPSPNLGKYRLIAGLGRGGMGDVFLAVVQGLAGFNKLVVIKQLRPSLASDSEFLAMFLDEARLAARLNHPNIVQTNEVGQDAANRYFIAMEHLDGQPYHRILRRAGSTGGLSLSLQIQVLINILDGLHYAHNVRGYDGAPLNIVHRDVSPQNIFVTYAGDCKVLDFGVAKAIGSTVETRAGTYKGKLGYMAPEQIHGEAVDRRADIFSVGVMLWTSVAGQSPWHGLSNLEIARRLLSGQVPLARDLQPAIDPALGAICDRALAPMVSERYQSAFEMRSDLDAYLDAREKRAGRKDLADAVERLFAADRVQMQRLIEAQIRDAQALAAGGYTVMPLPVVEGSSPGGSRLSALGMGGRSGLLEEPSPLREFAPAPSPRGSKRLWIGTGVAIVALIVAGLAFFGVRPGSSPTTGAVAPVVRVPALELTPRAAAAQAPTLEVRVTPASATLVLDGEKVHNPLKRSMEPDGRPHQLRVEAPGYRTESRSLVVEAAMLLEIALVREAEEPAQHRAAQEPEARMRRPAAPVRRAAPVAARAVAKPEPGPPVQAAPEMVRVGAPTPPAKPRIDIVADPKVDIVE